MVVFNLYSRNSVVLTDSDLWLALRVPIVLVACIFLWNP